ncbi:MAG: ribonuclease Z [Lachnospiraceae bacterium]|nr:ribonuclease Z [Lachnospiraceae bacterium]
MLDICLLGTGGMMPLPNRYLTALMMRYNGSAILVDCGEATQIAMKKRGWSPRQIDVICITHFHADHISGLPGLLLSMGNADRTEEVLMIGPKGLKSVVESLMVITPRLPFSLRFEELREAETSFVMDKQLMPGMAVTAFKVKHNMVCYGYRFDLARIGRFNVEAAKEAGIEQKYWNRLQKGDTIRTDDGRVFTPDMVLGRPRKGIRITYATDTRPTEAIVKNAQGADLFVCEGMYGEPDKLDKAKEHMHMTMYEAARIAVKADPKELWLTHYSPSMLHPQEFHEAVKKIFPRTVTAKDGRMVTLWYEDEDGET